MRSSTSLFTWSAILALTAVPQAMAQQQGQKHAPPKTDKEMIASALAAAPKAVARNATVIAVDEKGNARVLRKGSGEFTCIPDNPMTPGNDPMCADKNGMAWIEAWMGKKPPATDKLGIAYMLKGGSDASNTDPFAVAPAPNHKWIETGPHLMVLGGSKMLSGYPTTADNPRAPYMMFPVTPYEHIMIPIR